MRRKKKEISSIFNFEIYFGSNIFGTINLIILAAQRLIIVSIIINY